MAQAATSEFERWTEIASLNLPWEQGSKSHRLVGTLQIRDDNINSIT